MSEDHRVVPVTSDHIDYSAFTVNPSLPVIDEDECVAICQEWSFVVELLHDTIAERDIRIPELSLALANNNHTDFHKAAHAIKGAALNMRLPALIDISKKCELLGKQLEVNPHDQTLLSLRQPIINHLLVEYQRVQDYLPIAEQKAAEEEGTGGYDNDNMEQQEEEQEQQEQELETQQQSVQQQQQQQQPPQQSLHLHQHLQPQQLVQHPVPLHHPQSLPSSPFVSVTPSQPQQQPPAVISRQDNNCTMDAELPDGQINGQGEQQTNSNNNAVANSHSPHFPPVTQVSQSQQQHSQR